MIIITGPTASGKTGVSDELAKQLNGEIINADTGQLYENFSVGTAKPDWAVGKERYHLFDLLDKPTRLSAVRYRQMVVEKVQDIRQRGRVPIVVGGTLFYIKNLLFALNDGLARPVEKQSMLVARSALSDGTVSLKVLAELDPKRASQLNQNDSFRIERALKIISERGLLPSSISFDCDPIEQSLCIFLFPEAEHLKKRIMERARQMLSNNAWVEETKRAINTNPDWEAFLAGGGLLGYNHILDYIKNDAKGDFDLDKTTQKIYKDTVMYAKRQFCFWRGLVKSVKNSSNCDVELVDYKILSSNDTVSDLLKVAKGFLKS